MRLYCFKSFQVIKKESGSRMTIVRAANECECRLTEREWKTGHVRAEQSKGDRYASVPVNKRAYNEAGEGSR